MKKKYLLNAFKFQLKAFENSILKDHYNITFLSAKKKKLNFIDDYFLYRKWQRQGKLKDFDILHINAWANFLNYKRVKGQVSVGESHGYHLGVNFERFLIDEASFVKRNASRVMELLLSKKINEKIQEFDLHYCSTADMEKPLREMVRSDVKWLPNPIDTSVFNLNGPKRKLKGDPAVFFPTRLHKDKRPEIGINIFREHILKEFPDATLHFLHQPFNSEYDYWKKKLGDNKTYHWDLEYMPHKTLAEYFRGADLVMGAFSIGALALIELQAMACGTPVIVNDLYELKTPIDKLGDLSVKLLGNKTFRDKWIKDKVNYVENTHSPNAVAKMHLKNLKKFV